MKLTGRIDEKESEINIREVDGRIVADIDGRAYDLEVSQPESGVFLFKTEGRVFEATVSPGESGEASVHVRGSEFLVSITDPKRLRGSGASDHSHNGRAEIRTAMPGKVVRVLVEVGTEVKKGDGVLVVEAMKMQNEMKSPKDGVVKEIRAAEGQIANAGEILAVIE
jgi:biotin carboxyl carrier protein